MRRSKWSRSKRKNKTIVIHIENFLSILSTPLNCHFVLLFAFVHGFGFIFIFLSPFSVPPWCVAYISLKLAKYSVCERARMVCAQLHSTAPDGYILSLIRNLVQNCTIDDHFNHSQRQTNKQKRATKEAKKTIRKIKRPLMKAREQKIKSKATK